MQYDAGFFAGFRKGIKDCQRKMFSAWSDGYEQGQDAERSQLDAERSQLRLKWQELDEERSKLEHDKVAFLQDKALWEILREEEEKDLAIRKGKVRRKEKKNKTTSVISIASDSPVSAKGDAAAAAVKLGATAKVRARSKFARRFMACS